MYILDTNTLIYFFRGAGRVADRMFNLPPANIGIPTVVLYEIEYGLMKSQSPDKQRKQLDELLRVVNVIPFQLEEAREAAVIRSDLERKGTPIGPYDVLVAACARAGNHTLVTHNTKEFQRIDKLQVEDWY